MSITTVHPGLTMERPTSRRGTWIVRGHADAYFYAGKCGKATHPYNIEKLASRASQGSGFFGMSAAKARALESWPEGLELLSACTLAEFPPPASIRRVGTWSDTGDEFCRDRFDAGIEDCWRTRRRTSRPATQILKLTVAIGGNASVTASELAWSGASAVAFCDAAEAAGYRVELQGVWYSEEATQAGEDLVLQMDAKASDEPVNLERLMTVIACPTFFRWHLLNTVTLCPDRVSYGLGHTTDTPAAFQGDYHIGRCHSKRAAQYALADLFAKLSAAPPAA